MEIIKRERTLVIIKPDGVQRSLIGEIIKRYERTGLKLVAMKMLVPQKEQVKKHYLVDPNWIVIVGKKSMEAYTKHGETAPFTSPEECGNAILEKNAKYLSSGPVVAMIWEGNQSVAMVRKITGSTEPQSSDVGTIRGDLTIDSYALADKSNRSIRNLIHASGSPVEAEKEIPIWFDGEEILDYRLAQEAILYDVNLDGILE